MPVSIYIYIYTHTEKKLVFDNNIFIYKQKYFNPVLKILVLIWLNYIAARFLVLNYLNAK